MAIVKGYPHKPPSTIAKAVVKGFTDNPFLTDKHRKARKKSSNLRHAGDHGKINNSDNSDATNLGGSDEET
jgi:hypothetical protein